MVKSVNLEKTWGRKKFGGKIYKRSTQGWPLKRDAQASAKKMRSIGYKIRVVYEDGYYRLYWAD